jgi:hypothetical protein
MQYFAREITEKQTPPAKIGLASHEKSGSGMLVRGTPYYPRWNR